ncbi:unnamed protein product [Pedinophyceae sp. YPF-701]|nr:unnamed protein product [Pedinophyceae sp. YPF-701]
MHALDPAFGSSETQRNSMNSKHLAHAFSASAEAPERPGGWMLPLDSQPSAMTDVALESLPRKAARRKSASHRAVAVVFEDRHSAEGRKRDVADFLSALLQRGVKLVPLGRGAYTVLALVLMAAGGVLSVARDFAPAWSDSAVCGDLAASQLASCTPDSARCFLDFRAPDPVRAGFYRRECYDTRGDVARATARSPAVMVSVALCGVSVALLALCCVRRGRDVLAAHLGGIGACLVAAWCVPPLLEGASGAWISAPVGDPAARGVLLACGAAALLAPSRVSYAVRWSVVVVVGCSMAAVASVQAWELQALGEAVAGPVAAAVAAAVCPAVAYVCVGWALFPGVPLVPARAASWTGAVDVQAWGDKHRGGGCASVRSVPRAIAAAAGCMGLPIAAAVLGSLAMSYFRVAFDVPPALLSCGALLVAGGAARLLYVVSLVQNGVVADYVPPQASDALLASAIRCGLSSTAPVNGQSPALTMLPHSPPASSILGRPRRPKRTSLPGIGLPSTAPTRSSVKGIVQASKKLQQDRHDSVTEDQISPNYPARKLTQKSKFDEIHRSSAGFRRTVGAEDNVDVSQPSISAGAGKERTLAGEELSDTFCVPGDVLSGFSCERGSGQNGWTSAVEQSTLTTAHSGGFKRRTYGRRSSLAPKSAHPRRQPAEPGGGFLSPRESSDHPQRAAPPTGLSRLVKSSLRVRGWARSTVAEGGQPDSSGTGHDALSPAAASTSSELETGAAGRLRSSAEIRRVWKTTLDGLVQHLMQLYVAQQRGRPRRALCKRDHDTVSVVLSDIVGYTAMSSTRAGAEVLDMLNEYFSRLDAVVDMIGAHKVETVGDAYIVACNLFEPDDNHEVSAMLMAEAMLRVAATVPCPSNASGHLEIRVGVHTGPLCSGILGTKRKLVTLVGDTMNTAARMEQTSRPGCVRVTSATWSGLPAPLQKLLEPESIAVKGKGVMATYMFDPTRGGTDGAPGPAPGPSGSMRRSLALTLT